MKSLSQNAAFISWHHHIASDDSLILSLLSRAGAVFYARTTEPQTLMHLETSSNLYGETVNPHNRTLTAGGSSGGEGALLGMRGSCLGIGTDIGGSIRSPAANNGVFGFRPTSYRLPMRGLAATMMGQEQIVPVVGPLSTTLEGCKLLMKTVIDQQPWVEDPTLVPIPWRMGDEYPTFLSHNSRDRHRDRRGGPKRLKVAVMWHDHVVRPHPPITRALGELVAKLHRAPNIDVVDWTPRNHALAWEILASLYFPDGAVEEKTAIDASAEPWRPLSHFIITENPYCKPLTVPEVWKLTAQREAYRAEYAKLWKERGGDVDVILCPVGPGVAPMLDHSRYWGYTAVWNLLDYPALVFPVSVVDQEKDRVEAGGYDAMNEQDRWNHELCQFFLCDLVSLPPRRLHVLSFVFFC